MGIEITVDERKLAAPYERISEWPDDLFRYHDKATFIGISLCHNGKQNDTLCQGWSRVEVHEDNSGVRLTTYCVGWDDDGEDLTQ